MVLFILITKFFDITPRPFFFFFFLVSQASASLSITLVLALPVAGAQGKRLIFLH